MEALYAAMTFMAAQGIKLAPVVGLFLGTAAGSLGTVSYVLVRLPEDYLHRQEPIPFLPGRSRWMRMGAKAGKNLAGAALVVAGTSMALRLVVFPGMLTIGTGMVLLDLPGKQRAVRRLFRVQRVLSEANRIRARFGKAPLQPCPAQADVTPAQR